jgi:hypothetical protein
MKKQEQLEGLIIDLKKVEDKLDKLLLLGSNDEKLVDKKRKLTNEIKKLKIGL